MELLLIGIGTGAPGHVTLEAAAALREAALVLVPRKGTGKEDLAHLRHAILRAAGAEVTTLAQGVPVGGELDYLDDGTISAALRARKAL